MENYRRSQGLKPRTIVPLASSRTNDGRSVPFPRQPGNIDLSSRREVKLSDGSIATIRSLGFNDGTSEVVIPTIGPNGEDLSDDEAINLYNRTGRHLGKFDRPQDAEVYAQWLHEEEERRIATSDTPSIPTRRSYSASADGSERQG